MMTLALVALGLWGYAYAGYPLALAVLARLRPRRVGVAEPAQWPLIGITIPAYNEAHAIAGTLEAVLAAEYPADRRQIVVISDASTDGTDDIVKTFAARGVELLRQPERKGKTAAENAARAVLRGDIVIQTDASVRIHQASIRQLAMAFQDPTVGCASSRDVSVARVDVAASAGEGAYVGYEMWVRGLETRLSGIVGASGSLFAIRRDLHAEFVPDNLSRDFAAALVARLRGFRSVSVTDAVCFVPRGGSLHQEYRRKVRTMARGLATLVYFRRLLNPLAYGLFAWMLASHKLVRWLLPWATVALGIAVAGLAPSSAIALGAALGGLVLAGLAAVGWYWPGGSEMPRVVSMPAFTVAGIVAGLQAWLQLLSGRRAATWEPTRRGVSAGPTPDR